MVFGNFVDGFDQRLFKPLFPIIYPAKVQMDDRVHLTPVPFVGDPQPLEQGFVARINLRQGRDRERLAETAGARQEVVLALRHQAVEQRGLVHIDGVAAPELGKGRYAGGQEFHARGFCAKVSNLGTIVTKAASKKR